MKTLKNINIVLKDKVVFGDLILNNDLIESIVVRDDKLQEGEAIVAPGFIDVHTHGGYSYDAMDATFEVIKQLSLNLVKEGTTSYLPTTMTQSNENITKSVKAIGDYYKNQEPNAAKVLGIHLEGPYVNIKAAGAQPIEHIRKPNVNEFKAWNKASGNIIKKVSLAPENDENFEMIKYLANNNIIASIAHTTANYQTVLKAIAAGATSLTHTYNAMTPLHHRDVGVVGAALLHNELTAEIIFDNIHVNTEAAKILLNNKTYKNIILITDSMRSKGLGDGISELGGQTVYVKNNIARLADGTLAGSILTMINGYKNLVNDLKLSLYEASYIASLNPAKELKVDNLLGSIEIGKVADLIILNSKLDLQETIINGKTVYKNK